jgi:hypothetical protein
VKNQIAQFCEQIQQAVEQKSLVKVSLGNYQGNEPALKNIYIRLVLIKNIEKLAFTFRYKTKDIVKNFDLRGLQIHC